MPAPNYRHTLLPRPTPLSAWVFLYNVITFLSPSARLLVLTRRLALHLLAPTVLVSLALVGACIFGVLYLRQLHVGVAEDFSENRESHLAATLLEATTRDLINLLR